MCRVHAEINATAYTDHSLSMAFGYIHHLQLEKAVHRTVRAEIDATYLDFQQNSTIDVRVLQTYTYAQLQ